MEDRLQKILSAAGLCSRRQAEVYIQQGRVTVNGRPATLGDKADPQKDTIALDGKPAVQPAARTVLMLYKPRGVVTTLSDERGRPTVADLVGEAAGRVWPVGRLDMDSEALDGQPLHPAKVRLLGQGEGRARLSVVIHEGKNRQIRRMCAQCGLTVVRLKRIREGGLALDRTLRPGQWRPLTETEQKQLVRETFLQE